MDDTGCVPVELVSRFLTASPGLGPHITTPGPACRSNPAVAPPYRAYKRRFLTTPLARGQTEGLNNFMKWLEARRRARGPVSTIDFRRNEGDRLSAPLAIRLALDANLRSDVVLFENEGLDEVLTLRHRSNFLIVRTG